MQVHGFGDKTTQENGGRLGAVFQTKNCNSILDKIENAFFLSKKHAINGGKHAINGGEFVFFV
jgi:hypothetical protein